MANNSGWENCSITIDQPGYFVSDISILGSEVSPIMDDSLIRTLPEEVVLWNSNIEYHPEFSVIDIPALPPTQFDPNPWSGNDQDLYDPEVSMGIPFSVSVYDPAVNVEFPGGFLRPPTPKVEYQVDPYIPPLNLDIPPLSLPDISIPYLALPDLDITNIVKKTVGLRRVNLNFINMCMSTSTSMAANGRSQSIDVMWAMPNDGHTYALFAQNGVCYWQRIKTCD